MEIIICKKQIQYQELLKWFNDTTKDKIFILEHQDVYTAGKSVKETLSNIKNIPAIKTNRGGLWTWHGKGQIMIYFIYNLHNNHLTLTDFLKKIEQICCNLIQQEINNNDYIVYADKDRRGFWIKNKKNNEIAKIGFIGLRISKGILTHGISINYNNNLEWFNYINPCGLGDVKITSIEKIINDKTNLNIEQFKIKTKEKLEKYF